MFMFMDYFTRLCGYQIPGLATLVQLLQNERLNNWFYGLLHYTGLDSYLVGTSMQLLCGIVVTTFGLVYNPIGSVLLVVKGQLIFYGINLIGSATSTMWYMVIVTILLSILTFIGLAFGFRFLLVKAFKWSFIVFKKAFGIGWHGLTALAAWIR